MQNIQKDQKIVDALKQIESNAKQMHELFSFNNAPPIILDVLTLSTSFLQNKQIKKDWKGIKSSYNAQTYFNAIKGFDGSKLSEIQIGIIDSLSKIDSKSISNVSFMAQKITDWILAQK